jgi:hypothetical protein
MSSGYKRTVALRQELVVSRLRPGAISARVTPATVRRAARDLAVFLCSLAVVGLLVAYALAGGGVRLATVADRGLAAAGENATVSGRLVDERGNGVEHARVIVDAATRAPRSASSSREGTFRVSLAGPCKRYEIRLTAEVQGRRLATRLRSRLCPGELLRVRARVVSSAQFLWLPR